MKHENYLSLTTRLGYSFVDLDLLKRALRHRSCGQRNNERLEFLGDSVLGFVMADELLKRFPEAAEGVLSRFRSSLVREETLSEVAKELQLGKVISVGRGELKTGGLERSSILSDCFEALVGAIYLDSDLPTCQECIISLFIPGLSHYLM